MTRIVAGLAKGRRLAVAAEGTRPTSDRAREALFNSLSSQLDLDGARVLDLFAGTGAVGLEALSRGARAAVFVESGRAQAEVLRRNIDIVALPGATIRRRPVADYLADYLAEYLSDSRAGGASDTGADGAFDFVFADPPYALTDDALRPILASLDCDAWLAPGAVVVVERSARGGPPPWPDGIESGRDRRYGEGVLWYGRRQ